MDKCIHSINITFIVIVSYKTMAQCKQKPCNFIHPHINKMKKKNIVN